MNSEDLGRAANQMLVSLSAVADSEDALLGILMTVSASVLQQFPAVVQVQYTARLLGALTQAAVEKAQAEAKAPAPSIILTP